MKCPYCNTAINIDWTDDIFPCEENDKDDGYNIEHGFCPECKKLIIVLQHGERCRSSQSDPFSYYLTDSNYEEIIYPKHSLSKMLDASIPEKYIKLYKESEQVNDISPRASATLSRYLLQMVLHEELHIKENNLEQEISKLEMMTNVPSTLVKMLQIMRRVANFGAHPKKSTNSTEILDVEKGESEVMLELIEQLFDYVFVKPHQNEEFLRHINEKFGIK